MPNGPTMKVSMVRCRSGFSVHGGSCSCHCHQHGLLGCRIHLTEFWPFVLIKAALEGLPDRQPHWQFAPEGGPQHIQPISLPAR